MKRGGVSKACNRAIHVNSLEVLATPSGQLLVHDNRQRAPCINIFHMRDSHSMFGLLKDTKTNVQGDSGQSYHNSVYRESEILDFGVCEKDIIDDGLRRHGFLIKVRAQIR